MSQLLEILRAQRRHLAQLRHYRRWQVDAAIGDATHTIHRDLRAAAWTPTAAAAPTPARPGTWRQAAPGVAPGWRYNLSGDTVIEIAIYPDIVRLAAHNLQANNTSHREAP